MWYGAPGGIRTPDLLIRSQATVGGSDSPISRSATLTFDLWLPLVHGVHGPRAEQRTPAVKEPEWPA